mmetsp:Transcript_30706/g.102216  ORF Transcript_30706/g.102216 Transcript_30706/m.102216 type:complete len:207 (-) Transcript_30706:309-929(-)
MVTALKPCCWELRKRCSNSPLRSAAANSCTVCTPTLASFRSAAIRSFDTQQGRAAQSKSARHRRSKSAEGSVDDEPQPVPPSASMLKVQSPWSSSSAAQADSAARPSKKPGTKGSRSHTLAPRGAPPAAMQSSSSAQQSPTASLSSSSSESSSAAESGSSAPVVLAAAGLTIRCRSRTQKLLISCSGRTLLFLLLRLLVLLLRLCG